METPKNDFRMIYGKIHELAPRKIIEKREGHAFETDLVGAAIKAENDLRKLNKEEGRTDLQWIGLDIKCLDSIYDGMDENLN